MKKRVFKGTFECLWSHFLWWKRWDIRIL